MPKAIFDWEIGSGEWEHDSAGDAVQTSQPLEESVPAHDDASRPRGRLKQALLIGVSIIGLVGVITALAITRRVDEIIGPVKEQVIVIHRMAQAAVAESDKVIFDSFVSNKDYIWHMALQQLFDRNALLERGPLGLHVQESAPTIVDIIISLDLTKAEVVTEQAYTATDVNGVAQTVRLRFTTLYHTDDRGWLLSPPDYEFWGDTLTYEGELLYVVYPERDEPVVQRLSRDLDALLVRACNRLAKRIICAPPFRVRLRLELGLWHLVNLFDESGVTSINWDSETPISLPTPTLIGLPTDEIGYQALCRGYAAQLLQATWDRLMGRMPNWGRPPVFPAGIDPQSTQPVPLARTRTAHAPLPSELLALIKTFSCTASKS